MKNQPTPRALPSFAALPNLAKHLMPKFLPALLLAGMTSLANAAGINPQFGTAIDPAGGSEKDYDATNSVPLSDFNTVSNLIIQANWTGISGTSGNTIDGENVDVQISHSPGFSASASTNASYNSSSAGTGYLWQGANGQQLTISFGTYNGSSFTADRTVSAAGLMLLNFGAAYTNVTIRYYDATNGLLSTQNFAGNADLQVANNGGDFFTGYTNSQEVIAKFTIDITRSGTNSSIALDALAYAVTPPPTNTASTRIYTSTTDGTWISGANWSGGTIFAGSAPNVSLADEGLADDIASFTNTPLAVGINMSTLAADGGVGLVLGAIDITGGTNTFQLGMGSGSTTNGIVQLNGGAWLGGSSNTMIRLSSGFGPSSLTISNVNAAGYTLGLRLGSTNGVFNVASGKTLTLQENIDEVGAGSGFSVTGGGTLILSGNNSALTGGQVQVNGGSGLRLVNPGAANTLGGADGPDVVMTSGTLALGNSFSLPNDILIPAGAGTVNIQSSASGISANYSGNVTALDDVQFLQIQSGGNVTVSGTNNSIATNKVVSFRCNGSGGDLTDNAIWSGEGRIVYATTSGGGGDTAISGQKTHSGGSTIDATFTNAQCVINTSSTGPAGAPTSGPFGIGTLTLGGTARAYLRARTNADITIGNPVTILSGGVQFTTTTDEKSLIFTGPATMVGGSRQLTVLVGQTDPAKYVEFSGGIGDDGLKRNLTKANGGNLRLSGTNTYTGNTIVSGGTLTLAAGGELKFVIGGNATNNQVINTNGTINLDGSFNLDLTNANTTTGNSWTLVTNTVTANYGATFSVKSSLGSFTEAANVHTLAIGGGKSLSFSEATGLLTVVSAGPSGPATLTNSVSGSTLTFTWPVGQSWRLVSQTNSLSTGLNPATNAWFTVPGGIDGSNSITIDPANPTVFYRLVYP